MSAQDHSRPVDIIAQTLKDLRTKPFWDTYTTEGGVEVISGVSTTILGSGTYEGVILGGYMEYSGDASLAGITSFQLKLDGVSVGIYLIDFITKLYRRKNPLPISIESWSFDGTSAVFTIKHQFHFQTSWELSVITGATANCSFTNLFPIGKNT